MYEDRLYGPKCGRRGDGTTEFSVEDVLMNGKVSMEAGGMLGLDEV